MADLSKIKVGDMLLVPVKATWVDDVYGAPVKVAFETIEFWLDRDTVSAVEHIPAPRVFKRGDWVMWDHGKADCIHRHCLFIKVVLADPALAVIDDNGQNFTVAIAQLGEDEAPE